LSRMFSFISQRNGKPCTFNPLGGRCPHNCVYCWSMGEKGLVNRYDMKKYQGQFELYKSEFRRDFKPGEFWFVQDMSDLFAEGVPVRYIRETLGIIREFPKTRFLLLTKNPRGYVPFLSFNEIPWNAVVGATVETDMIHFDTPSTFKVYREISNAVPPSWRLVIMQRISEAHTHHRLFISVEPILDFTEDFAEQIRMVRPWAVAVGYDNYHNRLPEPPLKKTLRLIEDLEKFTKVYRKTLRKAWYEK